ncbi:MAG: AAA family ATPase, partial [Polyangiales bacterium]
MIPRAPRLFGRDRDLAIVREAIDLGSAAIVGAPGVGKTELALHLAATSERQVVWVDVSSAWDGDEARAAIARELGIPLRTRDPADGSTPKRRCELGSGRVPAVP